jgi:hypothetical protein
MGLHGRPLELDPYDLRKAADIEDALSSLERVGSPGAGIANRRARELRRLADEIEAERRDEPAPDYSTDMPEPQG